DPMGRCNNKHRWHDFSPLFCRDWVGTDKQHYFRRRVLLLVSSSRVGAPKRLQYEPRSIQNLCATGLREREWANTTDADGRRSGGRQHHGESAQIALGSNLSPLVNGFLYHIESCPR